MKPFILVIAVFMLVKPVNSRPIADEFDVDDPDQGEDAVEYDRSYKDSTPQENQNEYAVDEDFAAAKRAYEELQIEINKMQETLRGFSGLERSETTEDVPNFVNDHQVQDQSPREYTEDENDEDEDEDDKNAEVEYGNFQDNNRVSDDEDDDNDAGDEEDDDDALAEDATQDAAQGEVNDEEDVDETKEEIDALQRDEGKNAESNEYQEREVEDNMNDDV